MPLTSSMENYLKTVFILYRKQGYARCVDISEYMGVTMPSVSRAVKELIKAEYLIKEANGDNFETWYSKTELIRNIRNKSFIICDKDGNRK